jgi:hypothetical protein
VGSFCDFFDLILLIIAGDFRCPFSVRRDFNSWLLVSIIENLWLRLNESSIALAEDKNPFPLWMTAHFLKYIPSELFPERYSSG